MKGYTSETIRNVALVGHGGCGKTTFLESVLKETGAIDRMGKVDEGNTVSDYDKMEKEKGTGTAESSRGIRKALTMKEILRIPGAKEIMVTFFCYCAVEQTSMLWGSSYMVLHNGLTAEEAASYASLFCIGITVGRFFNGFLMMRFTDNQMIRAGQAVIIAGIVILLLPFGKATAVGGLILIGLGCAPVYPCIIHSTPANFGPERSQALIGVQMASAYVGSCLMPPLFGLLANHISASLLPWYLLVNMALMVVMHTGVIRKTRRN